MKKFAFTLQGLQTLRERQEQMALQEYAKTVEAWEQARKKAAAALAELEAAWAQRQETVLAGCRAADLDRLHTYSQSAEQRAKACDESVKAAQNTSNAAFTRLLAARQARAVVDKFFEKQKRRHEREHRRAEQRSLDEMVNHREALTALIATNQEEYQN